MIEFQWRGRSALGVPQKGVILAASKEQAQLQLTHEGVYDVTLQRNWHLPHKASAHDIQQLCQQLAMLAQAKVPIKQAIDMIYRSTTHQELYRWLGHLDQQLSFGYSLSQALAQYPTFFNAQERELINIGEQSGELADIFQRIAQARQARLALQQKLQKIAFYPTLVFVISFVLTLLLLLFVVPEFAQMYQQNSHSLPHFTQWLLHLSHLAQAYGIVCCVGFFMLFLVLKMSIRKSVRLQQLLNRTLLNMPLIGSIMQSQARVQLSQNLSLMLNAGLTLMQAIDILVKQNNHSLQHTALQQCQQLLMQGYRFSQSVSFILFSQQEQSMLRIAEQSNALALILAQIAQGHRDQLNHKIDLLSQVLEPLLMLVIGVLIGGVMLGLYLPIFNMGAVLG
ncbi:type II secretion system F family protein [Spirabiliibacterium falconis]|uniref:type II secretion system F family protein n=1 Tax=Spirabiliibacterium falconis TaxID=572023 RepID=UPI001AAC92DD|nr:type II secretion system F family protein [Spirabiliibacterium falconis]MBE2895231.1 type II secretion system F family protein [Spirabiliibacterium falconis]